MRDHESALHIVPTGRAAMDESRSGDRRDIALELVRHAMRTFRSWRERSRQRRDLARLNDRLLRDIGLTRADVESEVVKRFWQD
ncbi:MAG TPA: DUF1127 domain-containing protein [Alphaproteobacteria bacterium]|nr:DUF1127 domain-containing protein [Alphaproteobacteria bacterium]